MSLPSVVRIATRADEDALIEHCRLHHDENGVYGVPREVFPFSPDDARRMIARAWDREGGLIGVIGPRDALEASIFLIVSKLWHTSNDHMHIEEFYTFVHPDFRKTKHVKALGDFAKACADELGLPLIGGLVANNQTESKLRLYQRMYGNPVGAFFIYHGIRDPAGDKEGLRFWDHPFPRPGVAVIDTRGLSREDMKALETLRVKRSNGTGIGAHG